MSNQDTSQFPVNNSKNNSEVERLAGFVRIILQVMVGIVIVVAILVAAALGLGVWTIIANN